MSPFSIRDARELGLAIRERRRELGWDQLGLASKVGVSRQWIIEVERGKPRAEVGLLLRTLAALNMQVWVDRAPDVPRGGAPDDIDAVVDRGRKRR